MFIFIYLLRGGQQGLLCTVNVQGLAMRANFHLRQVDGKTNKRRTTYIVKTKNKQKTPQNNNESI